MLCRQGGMPSAFFANVYSSSLVHSVSTEMSCLLNIKFIDAQQGRFDTRGIQSLSHEEKLRSGAICNE